MNSTFNFRQFLPALKWIISVLVIAYVVYEFVHRFHSNSSQLEFAKFAHTESYVLFFLFLLMGFFNILIEAMKWKFLVKPFEKITLLEAISSVFVGLSLAIISPGRIGDFVGKAIQLKQINSSKGIVIALLGHAAQYIVILLLGTIAMGLFYTIPIGLLLVLEIFLLILCLTLYIKLPVFLSYLSRFKLFVKFQDSLNILEFYTVQQKTGVLLYSLLKYLLFVFQFYILLHFFGVSIGFNNAIIGIFCAYLVQLLMPSFLLLELGVRGAAAVYFLGAFSAAIPEILLATYLLWTFNIALPAVLGLYFFNRKSV
jgi:uncharacterized membrane protein YbhN (UPF0104 family)